MAFKDVWHRFTGWFDAAPYALPIQSIWPELLFNLDGWRTDGLPIELSGEEREKQRTVALDDLKYLTGQDFGYDAEAWRSFMKAHPNIIQERTARGELPPDEPFNLEVSAPKSIGYEPSRGYIK